MSYLTDEQVKEWNKAKPCGLRCENCRWWVEHEPPNWNFSDDKFATLREAFPAIKNTVVHEGDCTRYAPRSRCEETGFAEFPWTNWDQLCGQHEA